MQVKRWFMCTTEGDIIDGPYKDKAEFDRVLALHIKLYKYTPVVKEEMIDSSTFTKSESYDVHGYHTGVKRSRGEDLCQDLEDNLLD